MTSVDVVKLFRAAGHVRDAEMVMQLEHALQCAALARRDRADDEVDAERWLGPQSWSATGGL